MAVTLLQLLEWIDTTSLLVFSCIFLLLFEYVSNKAPKNFPPGPLCLPFIGNLHNVDFQNFHIQLAQWSKKYGSVFSIRIFGPRLVVLNGYKLVKKVYVEQGDNYTDRPDVPLFRDTAGDKGVLGSNGYAWKQQRRFALSTLRNFGLGKKSLEPSIHLECRYLTEAVSNEQGRPFNPRDLLNCAVSNVICVLVFGDRFEYSDSEFQNLLKTINKIVILEGGIWGQIYNMFPWLMRRAPGPHQQIFTLWNRLIDFARRKIEEHKVNYDPSNPRDYIDCFLIEMKKWQDDQASGFNIENLCCCTLDLFGAGTETTATTLSWGLLYMIKYPAIQAKVQAEIDRVVGSSRQPSVTDRENMPYTNAVIHEIQRMGNIIPLNVARAATKDTQIEEYSIPKGTMVVGNLTSILFDETEWETPQAFNPGHFLDAKGNFRKREAFIPFSTDRPSVSGMAVTLLQLLEWIDTTSLLVFSCIFLLLFEYVSNKAPKNFPPGPLCLPFIGNLHNVDFKNFHIQLAQWAKKYGSVFSIRIFGQRLVVLNGYKLVKKVYVDHGDNYTDRPYVPMFKDTVGDNGIIGSNGYTWKQQRRFALSTLRNFGLGKKSLEPSIHLECRYLTEAVSNEQGRPFNPQNLLNCAVSNVICVLVFGDRFEYSESEFQVLLKTIKEVMDLEGGVWGQLYNTFPWLMRRVPGPHKNIFTLWNKMTDFARRKIEEHKVNYDTSNPRDYIDCFLMEMEKWKDDGASSFNMENLCFCTLDLFIAGTETTATTLSWGLLYMIKYPEIQAKVQSEIDQVVGSSRQPSVADRENLPYTNAVIHEIQRMGNILPLNLVRAATKDTQIEEYSIPKGTMVVGTLTSILFDETEWETPQAFNPSHFLDANGNFRKREAFIPFSAGKRVCLGEPLARMELFLFFTTLLQRFTFQLPEGVEPSLEFILRATHSPKPYQLCAVPR
ncbi:hypothetical protein NFI96_024699 [Prochilodus magdalenae]|nr:hypothetical protein NFI96_024699 [Prochilodus magdalenae]